MARAAPTRAARITRGSRSCSRTASCVPLRPPDRCSPGSRSSRGTTTAPGGSGRAPTQTPASSAATSATTQPASTRPGRRRLRGATGSVWGRVPVAVTSPRSALEGLRDRLGEVGDPRSPAGGDVVVRLEDLLVLDGRDRVERGALGHGLGGLLAALGVGEDDEVRRLADDVLGGQLGVAPGRVGGA